MADRVGGIDTLAARIQNAAGTRGRAQAAGLEPRLCRHRMQDQTIRGRVLE